MLEPLLRHATMPADLVDWASYAGDDVDSFTQFRCFLLLCLCQTCLRGCASDNHDVRGSWVKVNFEMIVCW